MESNLVYWGLVIFIIIFLTHIEDINNWSVIHITEKLWIITIGLGVLIMLIFSILKYLGVMVF